MALTPDGDLISGFSYGEGKGRLAQLLLQAIREGGRTADHFDTVLTELYLRFGIDGITYEQQIELQGRVLDAISEDGQIKLLKDLGFPHKMEFITGPYDVQ